MNKQEFQEKINSSEKPLVVDFWATWCAPCMMTKPILEKLGKEYAEDVEFLPINADESRDVLEDYRILGIPIVLAFKGGKEVARVTGAQNEAGYRAIFESMAKGVKVEIPMTQIDRMLRLGAGGLLVMYGLPDRNWIVVAIGAVVAFLGIYDRCPIWNALTKPFQRK